MQMDDVVGRHGTARRRGGLVAAALVGLLALSACRGHAAPAIADRLPVQTIGVVSVPLVPYRLPLVLVRVPDGEALLVVDTGASHTLLDAGFVEESGLSHGTWDEPVQVGASEGRALATDRWADVPWIELGGVRTGRFAAVVADIAHLVPDPPEGRRFGGVLGTDFLKNVAPFLDGPAGSLHLLPAGDIAGSLRTLVPPGTAFQQFDITLTPRPVFELSVEDDVGALPFPVLLDSGAVRTHLPTHVIEHLQLDGAGDGATLDVAGESSVRLHRLAVLELGTIVARDVTVAECGPSDALLGWDVLGSVPFVVDYAARRLWMRVPR